MYRIYNAGKEQAIAFVKDVKNAVKNKDYELKSIDVKAYIKNNDKLYKEYKSLINTCFRH